MEKTLRSCADQIVEASIRAVLPDEAVRRALKDFHPEGRTVLVAAGKAAWQMAHAAVAVLGHVDGGVVKNQFAAFYDWKQHAMCGFLSWNRIFYDTGVGAYLLWNCRVICRNYVAGNV